MRDLELSKYVAQIATVWLRDGRVIHGTVAAVKGGAITVMCESPRDEGPETVVTTWTISISKIEAIGANL